MEINIFLFLSFVFSARYNVLKMLHYLSNMFFSSIRRVKNWCFLPQRCLTYYGATLLVEYLARYLMFPLLIKSRITLHNYTAHNSFTEISQTRDRIAFAVYTYIYAVPTNSCTNATTLISEPNPDLNDLIWKLLFTWGPSKLSRNTNNDNERRTCSSIEVCYHLCYSATEKR